MTLIKYSHIYQNADVKNQLEKNGKTHSHDKTYQTVFLKDASYTIPLQNDNFYFSPSLKLVGNSFLKYLPQHICFIFLIMLWYKQGLRTKILFLLNRFYVTQPKTRNMSWYEHQ
jgi:hypothetical protein